MCIDQVRSIGSLTIALTLLSFFSSFSGLGFWLSGRAAPFCAIASNAGRLVSAVPLNRSHSRRIGPAVRPDDLLKNEKALSSIRLKINYELLRTMCGFSIVELLLLLLLFIRHVDVDNSHVYRRALENRNVNATQINNKYWRMRAKLAAMSRWNYVNASTPTLKRWHDGYVATNETKHTDLAIVTRRFCSFGRSPVKGERVIKKSFSCNQHQENTEN